MPLNYENAVRLYEKLPTNEADRHMREIFKDRTARAGFDFGRLFEQCFGIGEFRDCRSSGRLVSTVAEAAGAVSTAAFFNISGQIVFSTMMEGFENEEFVFTKLIPVVPTTFQMGEKIPGITKIGDESQVVGEGKPYPLAGVSEDYIETPATVKYGEIVPVTREAIFGDRTGQLLDRCGEVGESMGLRQEEEAVDCVIDENVTAHRYKWRGDVIATYGDNSGTHSWDNLSASTPFTDEESIDTLVQIMKNIVDPNTGKPIKIMPTDIVYPHRLERKVMRALNATNVRTGNYATSGTPVVVDAPSSAPKLTPISSKYIEFRQATKTSWYIGNIKKAFRYMQNWGLEVTQAPPNSAAEFERDIVAQYKGSRKGAYATFEPRAMAKATA